MSMWGCKLTPPVALCTGLMERRLARMVMVMLTHPNALQAPRLCRTLRGSTLGSGPAQQLHQAGVCWHTTKQP